MTEASHPAAGVSPPGAPGDLRIGVLGPNLVAEKVRRLAGGVGNQRLGLGQFQLERLAQEPSDPGLDLLGFVLGSGESEQPVVALCRASVYADRRGRMPGWDEQGLRDDRLKPVGSRRSVSPNTSGSPGCCSVREESRRAPRGEEVLHHLRHQLRYPPADQPGRIQLPGRQRDHRQADCKLCRPDQPGDPRRPASTARTSA
jgi:hypothetical protein